VTSFPLEAVELRKQGTTILVIEQNARAALKIADRAYVIETGRVVLEGPASQIANGSSVKSLYLGR
jgi:branched-chain amino acid transport system ATP-binding protein